MKSAKYWLGRIATKLGLIHRSNGLHVRRSTAIHIQAADSARTRQDWTAAAAGYRLALTKEPHLHHLWIQLGHMEKEAGAIDSAAAAYNEAARLRPDNVEPLLHLGHMAKAWRQLSEGAQYFIEVLQRERDNVQALAELARLMPDQKDATPELWTAALQVLGLDVNTQIKKNAACLPSPSMLFDVTDLLAFFGQRRLPTGIQRVQIEISLALLQNSQRQNFAFCLYSSTRRGWICLDRLDFESLCLLAKQSDDAEDPAWKDQLVRIYRSIAISDTVRFPSGTVLVNLGTSWSDRNYLLDVRTVRARDHVIYVPLVFDLIPLIEPDWFSGSLVRDFSLWFQSLLHSSDGCIAISESTRQDLIKKSIQWQTPVPAGSVPVVRLDGNFQQKSAPRTILQNYKLQASGYVLLVSTLEPRKNHVGAFQAWLALANILGEETVPTLVCVGGRGWLNDNLHQMMHDCPQLQRIVRIMHGVPDNALATLYEHCLFALYPSFYEGWGLPVSEALSYGKVPAISDTSSLPEAGGPYACYFDPHDTSAIVETVRALLDDGIRSAAERVIKDDYMPRSWRQIAQDLIDKAQSIPPRGQGVAPYISGVGSWSLRLPRHDNSGDMPGETLRHGHSWMAPTSSGSKIEGSDAALYFHWSGVPDTSLQIHFTGKSEAHLVYIELNEVPLETHIIDDQRSLISLSLPADPELVRITIKPSVDGITVEKIVIVQSCKLLAN